MKVKVTIDGTIYKVTADSKAEAEAAARAVHAKAGDAVKTNRSTIKNLRSNLEMHKKVLKNADPESTGYQNSMDFIADYDMKVIPGMKAELKSMMDEVNKIEKDVKKVVGR